MKISYTLKQVISLHDKIIEETGGLKGVLSIGLLEEALHKPFMGLANGVELYPGITSPSLPFSTQKQQKIGIFKEN